MNRFRYPIFRALGVAAVALLISVGCDRLDPLNRLNVLPECVAADNKLSAGDIQGAKAQFDAILKKAPDNLLIYETITRGICAKQGKWDLFVEYSNRALTQVSSLTPVDRARVLSWIAGAYLQMGEHSKALDHAQKAHDLVPKEAQYMNDLGYMMAVMPGNDAQLPQALDLTEKAVSIAIRTGVGPEELGRYLDSLGWVQYKMRKYDLALISLAKSAELSPGEVEIHLHLAKTYEALNRPNEAYIQAQRAFRSKPRDPVVLDYLNSLAVRVGAPQQDIRREKPAAAIL